jgi:hypothetical protein
MHQLRGCLTIGYSVHFRRMYMFGMFAPLFFSLISYAQSSYPQPHAETATYGGPAIPMWLSLDFLIRGRTERQTAIGFTSSNDHAYELSRVWGGIQIKPTSWITGYAQFLDLHALGLPLKYTASNMRDSFDLRQGFVRVGTDNASIKAGRQELSFGGERLVGISDWSNTSRTFDGFSGRFGNTNRLDIFSASVVKVAPTSFDDHARGLNFHGIYGTISTLLPKTTLEPYLLVKALPGVKSQQGSPGNEAEFTFGMRLLERLPQGFEYVVEGALQRGSYSSNSIHAGAGYGKVGYNAPTHWNPRLQLEYDYATGNPHRNLNRISTFDQLYPSSHNTFGLTDLLGWQNIQQRRLNFDVSPQKHLTVSLQQEFLQVANQHDSVYSGSGGVLVKPPTAGFVTSSIGHEFDASARYVLNSHYIFNAGIAHFSPGTVMEDNSHGTPITLGYLSLTYHLSIGHEPERCGFRQACRHAGN